MLNKVMFLCRLLILYQYLEALRKVAGCHTRLVTPGTLNNVFYVVFTFAVLLTVCAEAMALTID